MLKELFIALKGGVSLFHHRFVGTSDSEAQLISGFISAISTFASRVFGEMVREINFSTTKLVIQEVEDKLFVVCVTGLEIPLDSIIKFQRTIGTQVLRFIEKEELDPLISSRQIKIFIESILDVGKIQDELASPLIEPSEATEPITARKSMERMVFIGLSKAGKSSIVEAFFNRKSNEELSKIPPTMGMKSLVPKIPFAERPIQIFDLGGHEQFIKTHIGNEALFMNTLNLVLVLDVSQLDRVDSAIEYFNKVVSIARRSSNPPVISILLHKVDPGSPPLDSSIYWKLTQSLFPNLSGLNWAIYQTSIYSDSLDNAMIESFLRALPEEYLAQSMSTFTMEAFDTLLPMSMSSEKGADLEDLFQSAMQVGKQLGSDIRSKWITFVLDNEISTIRESELNVFTKIERVGRDIKFSLTWPIPGQANHPDFPTIFSGLLTGILSYAGTYKVERKIIELGMDMQHCEFWGKRL